ncbi:MAG: YraN family protein [Syntrophales bacterium]
MAGHLETGIGGEAVADAYLKKAGYHITERNYHCRIGELDIITEEDGNIVFIEVRSKHSTHFGDPAASIGALKRRKLSLLALHYLQARRLEGCRARFDVVSVSFMPAGIKIDLIRNAFDLAA